MGVKWIGPILVVVLILISSGCVGETKVGEPRTPEKASPSALTPPVETPPQTTLPPTTVAPRPKYGKMNEEWGVKGHIYITINNLEESKKSFVDTFGLVRRPAGGKKFVILDVLFRSDSEEAIYINAYFANLQDNEGFTHQIYPYSLTYPTGLQHGNLYPYGKQRGYLLFEIPENNAPAVFFYDDMETIVGISLK